MDGMKRLAVCIPSWLFLLSEICFRSLWCSQMFRWGKQAERQHSDKCLYGINVICLSQPAAVRESISSFRLSHCWLRSGKTEKHKSCPPCLSQPVFAGENMEVLLCLKNKMVMAEKKQSA